MNDNLLLICSGFATINNVIPSFKVFGEELITLNLHGPHNILEYNFIKRSFCEKTFNSCIHFGENIPFFEVNSHDSFVSKFLARTVGEVIFNLPSEYRFDHITQYNQSNFNEKVTSIGMTDKIILKILNLNYNMKNIFICLSGLDVIGTEKIHQLLSEISSSSIEINYYTLGDKVINENSTQIYSVRKNEK